MAELPLYDQGTDASRTGLRLHAQAPLSNYGFADGHNHPLLRVSRGCSNCRGQAISCDGIATNTWPCLACREARLHCAPPAVPEHRQWPILDSLSSFDAFFTRIAQPNSSNSMPPFNAVTTLGILSYAWTPGVQIKVDLQGTINRGFFLDDGEWTCYRRNYFSCTCSYSLSPLNSNDRIQLLSTYSTQLYTVYGFAMSISAVLVDSDPHKHTIDLVQHTSRQDKGPRITPEKVRLMPKSSQLLPPDEQGDGQSQTPFPSEHIFERIQFKAAAAGNGKRRVAQQYYHLIVELWADVGTQKNDQFIKVAYKKSARMIVRGRSTGHPQSENRGSVTSGQSSTQAEALNLSAPSFNLLDVKSTSEAKQNSFSSNNITHHLDAESAIDSDTEGEYVDESAIDDDDDSSDWEDSIGESRKPYVDEKFFQHIETKANLTSRPSLITLMMAQNDHAITVGSQSSQSAALSIQTTRRNMLATELTEDLRRQLLWERQQKLPTANAVLKRRHKFNRSDLESTGASDYLDWRISYGGERSKTVNEPEPGPEQNTVVPHPNDKQPSNGPRGDKVSSMQSPTRATQSSQRCLPHVGLLSWVRRISRPRLKQGHRRIEWTCDCGVDLYGDFAEDKPSDLDALELSLHTSAESTSMSSSSDAEHSVEMPTSPRHRTLSSSSSDTTALSAGSTEASSIEISQSKFLALCVNTGVIYKTLAELDTSRINSDGEAFLRMKKAYLQYRGVRSRVRFLIKPVTVEFVRFTLWNLRRGYVSVCDRPSSMPPNTRIDYDFIPPPMPPEVFVHYLEHGDGDLSPNRYTWLPRLPKRLNSKVTDCGEAAEGWGVHVIEGPNREAVFWIVMATISASVLTSVLWATLKGDIQGGTGLGALIMTLPPVIMAAFLFRLGAI